MGEDYQVSLSANWIWRDGLEVTSICPALPIGVPFALKRALLSTGGAKLGWLRMLKASARNCRPVLSEMKAKGKFLTSEKSTSNWLGPVKMLRDALPRT